MWKNSILICEYNQVVSVHIRIHKYMIYQITPHQIYVIISRFCGQEPGRRALLDRDMDGRCEVYLAVASFSYFWLVNYYLILHRPPISSPASNPTLSIFCWFSLTKSWVEEHDDSAHLISWFPIRHNSQVLIIYFFCVIIQSVILISCNIIMDLEKDLALSLIPAKIFWQTWKSNSISKYNC